MYSLLKDQDMDEDAEQTNPAELVQSRQPMPVVYNAKIPGWDGKGGLGQMYKLFGDRMDSVIDELKEALAA